MSRLTTGSKKYLLSQARNIFRYLLGYLYISPSQDSENDFPNLDVEHTIEMIRARIEGARCD